MRVEVSFAIDGECVFVLVVFVMPVLVVMVHELMLMFMVVLFCEMQPDTDRHQPASRDELNAYRFMQQRD